MLNISFNFNEETRQITNIKVVDLAVSSSLFDMTVDENKLVLSPSAVEKLRAVAGDRIAVNYWQADKSKTYPIISKADMFDGEEGNKLTKSNTISFKGQQRTTLLKFGTQFVFEEWADKNGEIKDGVFILKPAEDDTVDEEKSFKSEEKSFEEFEPTQLEDDLADLLGDNAEEDPMDILPF